MKDVRGFSLGAHAAAREVPDFDPARSTARAAGQAMATAHVKTHSVAAAIYAATAIRDASRPEKAEVAVRQEKEWQLNHLLELLATKGKRSPDKA
jgi:hypothetical protein